MNKFTIMARSVARRVGLTRMIRALAPEQRYEQNFSTALLAAIHPGDNVWDIGANVGFYTKIFLDTVGQSGTVVAFEPSPDSAAQVLNLAEMFTNLRVIRAALGSTTGTAAFEVNDDKTSPTNHLAEYAGPCGNTIKVAIYRGEDAWEQLKLPTPQLIKIDVEGYELECIEGLGRLLNAPSLKAVFVEIHFGILADRGKQFAPLSIEQILKKANFTVRWIDSSHIQATRD